MMRNPRVTISVQLTAAVTVFLGTPYSALIGIAYVALSSMLACRVFRMVLLCDKPDGGQLNTAAIESIFRGVGA